MELFHRPANRFVAEFIGSPPMNFITAQVRQESNGQVMAQTNSLGEVPLTDFKFVKNESVHLGLRPQYIGLGEGPDTHHRFEATVGVTVRLGSETLINLTTENDTKLRAVFPDDLEIVSGQSGVFNFDVNKLRVFEV